MSGFPPTTFDIVKNRDRAIATVLLWSKAPGVLPPFLSKTEIVGGAAPRHWISSRHSLPGNHGYGP